MPGIPSRLFELEIAPLLHKQTQGVPGAQLVAGLQGLLEPKRIEQIRTQQVVPLGLRWRVTPEMGLPRTVFSVWRRPHKLSDAFDVTLTAAQISAMSLGNGLFHVPSAELYVLRATIQNSDPTQPLRVDAVDTANQPIPLHTVSIPANSSRSVRFQHPFIGGIKCTGTSFQITAVRGATMQALINRTNEWELIEQVGLPAQAGEISGYDPLPQGYPTLPKTPPDAAITRLNVAQQFYQALPTILPSGVTVPTWDIPKPAEAVDELRGDSPSLIQRLNDMFQEVDAHITRSQEEYHTDLEMPGIHQPEFPDQVTENAIMHVPLLATMLINAYTDPWFGLASGFGTTDFPELARIRDGVLEPAAYFHMSHDYMVSATFVFYFFIGEFGTLVEEKVEHCALSHRSMLPPIPANQLQAEQAALNRPPLRDDPWSIETALTWAKINRFQIQGNAIAVAEQGMNGGYLNPLRPAVNPTKPALFVPAKPGETGDPNLLTKNRFIHHQTELPFVGTRMNRYGVACMDAFGRWSDWRVTSFSLAARLPESPRLNGLSLNPDRSGISGNTAPHTLTFEVIWDWQDRSPKRIQLAAVFHRRRYFPDGTRDTGHIPPEHYPAIFQIDSTTPFGVLIELVFPSDTPPGTPPAFAALPTCTDSRVNIELLPQSTDANGQNVDAEMRRYRVTIANLLVSFQPDEEWFYTMYAKAAEWRNPALFSDSTAPIAPGRPPRLTAFVPNPIPAPPPQFVPATVLWATLPDARGISRYRLAFDRVTTATGGYAIYQAFEAKLRDLAGLPVRNDTDLVGRATDLRDLAMPLAQSVDAFQRINTRLVPQPAIGAQVEYEIEIPGTLDGLVVFAVCSVTREQETSALSTPWLFVGVPRRNIPAAPQLSLAQQNGTVTLTYQLPKAPTPERVELLRVRREFVANSADTMGQPVHTSTRTEWQTINAEGQPASNLNDITAYRFSFAELAQPSWFPYFYRAVALSGRDDSNGFLPGRSPQSNLVRVERLPTTLPELKDTGSQQIDAQVVQLQFRSDALVEATPRGSFQLELFAWDATQNRFAETATIDSALSNAELRPTTGTLEKNTIYYAAPGSTGRRQFSMLVDVPDEAFMYRIRLTDPLQRSSETIITGKMLQNASPDLSNGNAERNGRDLLIGFASTTRVTQPPFGMYQLEIAFAPAAGGGVRLLLNRPWHLIRVGNLENLAASPVTTIIRDAKTSAKTPIRYGAIIKRFFPPLQFPGASGRLRILLTAPDGTEARLEIPI